MHRRGIPFVAALALVSPLIAAPSEGGNASEPVVGRSELTIRWTARRVDPASPPASLPSRARRALDEWAAIAAPLGLRIDIDGTGRVLLLSDARRHRSTQRAGRLVKRALEAVDQLAPRAVDDEREDGCLVLLRADARVQMVEALTAVDAEDPRAPDGLMAGLGFGCWLESDDPLARRRSEGELVRRLVRLALADRLPALPAWLSEGCARHVEATLLDQFVRDGEIDEERAWRRILVDRYGAREGRAPTIDELAEWSPEVDGASLSPEAWGLVDYLARYRSDALVPLLAELGAEAEGRQHRAPARRQQDVILRVAGADSLTECTRAFREGHRYRPKKK